MKYLNTSKIFLLFFLLITASSNAQFWNVTGNSGTIPPTNFLGTTDANPLLFKVNNLKSAYLDYDPLSGNTSYGHISSYTSFIGINNTSNGFQSMAAAAYVSYNTANGPLALINNSEGSYNTALGSSALYFVNSSRNTGIGRYTQYYSIYGSDNISIGHASMFNNSNGNKNTSVGLYSLYTNVYGNNHTAIGAFSMYSSIASEANTAFGAYALSSEIGNGTHSTAFGIYVLKNSTSNGRNTGVGNLALEQNTGGYNNTSVGIISLNMNTTGESNTAIGDNALGLNTTGILLTGLGNDAAVSSTNYSNTTVIGAGATGTASYQVRIGNSSVTDIGGYVSWTNFSDGRFKRNIKENVPGLSFILKLRPVTYNISTAKIDQLIRPAKKNNESSQIHESLNVKYRKFDINDDPLKTVNEKEKEKILQFGFIAQEVESICKKIGYDFSGIDAPKNNNDLYSLRYAEFVVPLVKAAQELDHINGETAIKIESLKEKNNSLRQQLNDLKEQIVELEKVNPISNKH